MRRTTVVATTALAAVALVTLSPNGGSDAQWRDSATGSVAGPRSEPVDVTGAPGTGATPQIDLTNQSSRHSSWVNVKSTKVAKVVGGDSNTILSKAALTYTYGAGA